jgi:AP-2 complex subunit mu-1
MRAYLSGQPECKFGLNDKLVLDKRSVFFSQLSHNYSCSDKTVYRGISAKKPSTGGDEPSAVELDDCQFHQCVKLGRFDSDRTISFIPPDGEFELMRLVFVKHEALP